MSESNRFGRIIDPDAVERAVCGTVDDYIATYLGEIERIKGFGPGEIALPAGVITTSEFAKWDEDALPLIMVVSPGLAGPPRRISGAGEYEAAWSVTVAAIVSDVDGLATRQLMGAYAAAIRALVVQHKALKSTIHPQGFAQSTQWVGESYGDIPFADTRAMDSCRVVFNVGVEGVVTQSAGPRTPSVTPAVDPGNWPPVSGVKVTTTPVEALA